MRLPRLGGPEALPALLSAVVDPPSRATALHVLAGFARDGGPALACLGGFLRLGADPHAWTRQGAAALHVAAAAGHLEACRLLVGVGGGRVWSATTDGATALHLGAQAGHLAVVDYLLAHPDCNIDAAARGGESAAMAAARHGHTAVLLALLAAGADVNLADEDGQVTGPAGISLAFTTDS